MTTQPTPRPPDLVVASITKVPTITSDGKRGEELAVQYIIRGRHTMVLAIANAKATAGEIEAAVKADAARFAAILDKHLSL